MKIAIIQEWLVTVGGSDKVVKAIADVFPDADIYTLVAKKQVCDELGIDWNKVHTSFIQKLPLGVLLSDFQRRKENWYMQRWHPHSSVLNRLN